MRTRPYVSAALLTFALLVPPAWGQEIAAIVPATDQVPVAQDTMVSDEPELIIQGAEPTESIATKTTNTYGADTLSVDFPDEDIRNILRNVADLFELNLVVPDTLQGRTSIKLRDVTWRQIYQVVLAPVGFTYVEDGNIIKVVSNDSLLQEPVATEVFILNYADAADILPTLNSLVDSAVGGKIDLNARSNALVITERPSRMNRIRPILEALDTATSQVMIESKFVEVTNSDIKNIGVNWSSLSGYQLSGSVNRNLTEEQGRDTITNRTQTNIDVPFMQNGYERADDVAGRNNGSGGTNPSSTTGIGPPFDLDAATGARSYSELGPGTQMEKLFTGGLNRMTTAVFNAPQFNVVLSALKTQNDTKLISNPTVVTLNNTEATINIGKEYPIPNYTYNQERGTYEVSGFEYRPIGIILKVTPQVNSRGFIKLNIEPEVSSSNESTTFGSATIPIVTTRKTVTQVSLRDGYTMGIGGLIENTITGDESRVPVLGSIPLLGRLFRSSSKNDIRRNLIIFITAKTVSADGAAIEDVFDSRAVRQLNMTRQDLPGYRDGSDPFLPSEPQVDSEED